MACVCIEKAAMCLKPRAFSPPFPPPSSLLLLFLFFPFCKWALMYVYTQDLQGYWVPVFFLFVSFRFVLSPFRSILEQPGAVDVCSDDDGVADDASGDFFLFLCLFFFSPFSFFLERERENCIGLCCAVSEALRIFSNTTLKGHAKRSGTDQSTAQHRSEEFKSSIAAVF